MKLLVAGAGGQVARSLAERAANFPDITLIAQGRPTLDLEQPGSARKLVSEIAPDVVINAAAYTAVDQAEEEPERAFRINRDGAGELAEAAADTGAAIIQLSTDYVFDGAAEGSYEEEAAVGPLNVYGESKLAGEAAVRAANSRHAIVRTAWVYSPFGRNFVTTMMAAAAERPMLTVVDDQRGTPTSALDLADGLLRMAMGWAARPEDQIGRIYHVAGPAAMSWFDFAAAIMEECGKREIAAAKLERIASADWPTKARRPRNSALDSGLFQRDFGFSMPPFGESLALAVERISRPR